MLRKFVDRSFGDSVLGRSLALLSLVESSEVDSEHLNEDDPDIVDDIVILAAIGCMSRDVRSSPTEHVRLYWEGHVDHLCQENKFYATYRMSLPSFNTLVDWTRNELAVNNDMANVRTCAEAVYPEIILHVVLRYLAGGSYLDIRLTAGICVPAFYSALHKGLNALRKCENLKI